MSNTYQAGLKFERLTAGVYRVINIKGRIIAEIYRHKGLTGTYWDLCFMGEFNAHSFKFFISAKDWIRDPAYKNLHLAEA